MTPILCIACRLSAASIYCQADAAYLCEICDITIHQVNKLSRRHTRVPIHEVNPQHYDQTIPMSSTTLEDTIQDHSETTSGLQVVPEAFVPHTPITHHSQSEFLSPDRSQTSFATTNLPTSQHSELSLDSIPFEQVVEPNQKTSLQDIADAFVKQEAQTLFQNASVLESPSSMITPQNDHTSSEFLSPVTSTGSTDLTDTQVPDYSLTNAHLFTHPYSHDMNTLQVPTIDTDLLRRLLHVQALAAPLPISNLSTFGTEMGYQNEFERIRAQRKLDRQAALKRFRTKRANRSFQKKVRYACRKQLADSRPRVKGRFVGRVKKQNTDSVVPGPGVVTKSS